jgi:hypothetical protein
VLCLGTLVSPRLHCCTVVALGDVVGGLCAHGLQVNALVCWFPIEANECCYLGDPDDCPWQIL